MALIRRGGCTFLIRSVRRGGRVTSEYVGSGPVAVLAAQLEAAERAEREATAAEWKAECARLDTVDEAVAELFRQVDRIARDILLASGFHQHKGQWRKRRTMSNQSTDPNRVDPRSVKEILKCAQEGDESTLPEFRAFLDDRPDSLGDFGDMAYHAERSVIEAFTGKNLLVKEAMARKMTQIAVELAGPDPSPIERLLARRAALCWFTVNSYETTYARHSPDLTLAQEDSQQRRIDRAHKRLLMALRSLALVRRVPAAALQVNIDRVNVASPATAAAESAPGLSSLPSSRGVGPAN